jgi:Fe-S-cluster containining protein
VDAGIFTATFAPDCMTHACRCRDEGDVQRNDACCQHGADVLVPEKAAILRRAPEIASVMTGRWRQPANWFDERSPEEDPNVPEGIILRTGTTDLDDDSSGCIFLEHDGPRGCGLHRAALVHGFDPNEIKPVVCRLYPLSLENRRLGFIWDFDRYSCAGDAGPTVYRVMRDALAVAFGPELVEALDRVETKVLKRRLRLLPRQASTQTEP